MENFVAEMPNSSVTGRKKIPWVLNAPEEKKAIAMQESQTHQA